jgi:hypothetical protein
MFDPANILPVTLEELVICERGVTECDRLHCNDTIGPCAACPIRLQTTSGPGDEES